MLLPRWSAISLAILLGPLAYASGPDRSTWAYEAAGVEDLIAQGWTGRGATVAVLDTGADLLHPALEHLRNGNRADGEIVGYRDFMKGRDEEALTDADGHGTMVLGILAGRPGGWPDRLLHGGASLRGAAPGADYLIGRVCLEQRCPTFLLADAIQWAASNGADVINLSLGGPTALSTPERDLLVNAVKAARDVGVVVVAAAGPSGELGAPADIHGVISVGAVGRDGRLLPMMTSLSPCTVCIGGGPPDVVAPGEGILTSKAGGGYTRFTGTSAATAFVSGSVALAIGAADPNPDPEESSALYSALVKTARPLRDADGRIETRAGNGIVQAEAALARWRGDLGQTTPVFPFPKL